MLEEIPYIYSWDTTIVGILKNTALVERFTSKPFQRLLII